MKMATHKEIAMPDVGCGMLEGSAPAAQAGAELKREPEVDLVALHRELLEGLLALKGGGGLELEKYLNSRMGDFKRVSYAPVDASEWAFLKNTCGIAQDTIDGVYADGGYLYVLATVTSTVSDWPKPMADYALFVFETASNTVLNYNPWWAESVEIVLAGEEGGRG